MRMFLVILTAVLSFHVGVTIASSPDLIDSLTKNYESRYSIAVKDKSCWDQDKVISELITWVEYEEYTSEDIHGYVLTSPHMDNLTLYEKVYYQYVVSYIFIAMRYDGVSKIEVKDIYREACGVWAYYN